jgi:hypothetical protein
VSGWRNVGRIHTIPVGDTAEHSLHADCACGPKLEYPGGDGDGVLLVVHNAFDGRDFEEHEQAKVKSLRELVKVAK